MSLYKAIGVLFRFLVKRPSVGTIGIGLSLVVYQHLVGQLGLSTQLVFCGLFLVLSGIPHGALDHLLEQERASRLGHSFSMLSFIANYLATAGLYGLLWLLVPTLSLLLFLLISAWHFGETDLPNAPHTRQWSLVRLLSGGFVLAFILLNHASEATPIIIGLVRQNETALQTWQWMTNHSGLLLRAWFTQVLILSMLASAHRSLAVNGWRLIRLLSILALTFYLPLLPAFMLYFGGWHSLNSFDTIRQYLRANEHSLSTEIWNVWTKSVPLTGLAFAFLLIGGVLYDQLFSLTELIPILFIFLSLITLPHVRVMHRIFSVASASK
ncbi:MAG: hypothetical protein EAZ91_02615 [Cytophagales bacterium]|nr:MAG: hypothetical protein EAZ91_02615 [Cytophagales bacterium]